MKYLQRIVFGISTVGLTVIISACSILETQTQKQSIPPTLVTIEPANAKAQVNDVSSKEVSETVKNVQKQKVQKPIKSEIKHSVEDTAEKKLPPQNPEEPDLTSLFAPLYKLPIQKADLNDVSGADIAAIQKQLNAIGYNVGSADGRMGKKTVAGINGFLQDFELPLDPRATGLLLKQLRAVTDQSKGTSIVDTIKSVQSNLQKLGFTVGKAGIADILTRQAISDYQLKENLVVDGRLTNQLLTALKITR